MIRPFLWSLFALAVGAGLAVLLVSDPGYILVHYRGYSIEATLVTVLVTLIIFSGISYAMSWLLRNANPLHLLRKSTWQRLLGRSTPAAATAKGLTFLLLGRWQEAYKLLVENAEKVESPQFSYLAASIAAFQRGDRASWSWCLDRAEKKYSTEVEGINSFRALLENRSGNCEQALAILLALKKVSPMSPFVLAQLKDIYSGLSDLDNLEALLPDLEKQQVLSSSEVLKLQERVFQHKLEQAAQFGLDEVRLIWQDLPKKLRDNETLTGVYLHALLLKQQDTEAGALLTRFLKQQWSDKLVAMLGFVNTKQPQQLLLMLEKWLTHHQNNPVLLLTLGRLSLRNQLWGKGRDYFQRALHAAGSGKLGAEISAERARLLDLLGEHEESHACYMQAMDLLEYKLPQLPLPIRK